MKGFETKKNKAAIGDYELVGEALGLSPLTVRRIRFGYRADHHNVLKALSVAQQHHELSRAELLKKLKALKTNKQLKQHAA